MKIYYQHPQTWFGDCMPFGKGDTFYLFHQRDTRVKDANSAQMSGASFERETDRGSRDFHEWKGLCEKLQTASFQGDISEE